MTCSPPLLDSHWISFNLATKKLDGKDTITSTCLKTFHKQSEDQPFQLRTNFETAQLFSLSKTRNPSSIIMPGILMNSLTASARRSTSFRKASYYNRSASNPPSVASTPASSSPPNSQTSLSSSNAYYYDYHHLTTTTTRTRYTGSPSGSPPNSSTEFLDQTRRMRRRTSEYADLWGKEVPAERGTTWGQFVDFSM
jgi:hypothetical protein